MTAATPSILAIIGPTASGKSALAMKIAEHLGGEILSVDSMQVYRGMDIGTAKPGRDERERVRHHLIDVVEPNESFTVSRYVALADAVIADAARRGVPLVVAGGTPLYFKSLFDGLFDGPAADAELRTRFNAQPLEALHARLTQVDPAAAERIHVNDRKRLVRALEVYELTGQPISSMQNEWRDGATPRYRATWIGLHWDRDAINRRINARVKQMIADGWVEETRELLNQYNELSKTGAEATGYAEIIAHLRGQVSLDDAIEQIKIATRQLARRQMKWFRRFRDVTWLDGELPLDELVQSALAGHSE